MHDPSLTLPPDLTAGHAARCGGGAWLADALRASRADTLATFEAFADAPETQPGEQRNPPLWELGHLGWFQEFWIARSPARGEGVRADRAAPRREGVRHNSDALYDSSRVEQSTRRSLPLPDAGSTRADLARQLDATMELLSASPDDADALYFFRLARLHEDMHHEAALYTAQSLGLPIDDPRWQPRPLAGERSELALDAARWPFGEAPDGFAFDNELGAHTVDLPATRIDARVLSWAEYLPFVDAGGYAASAGWSDAGVRWRQAHRIDMPRYLRRTSTNGWEHRRHGRWQALDLRLPACHLSAFEAEAWCRWGRPPPADRDRVGARRHPAAGDVPVGRRVGVDRQHLPALPRFRAAPVPRLLRALVRRSPGAARRLVHDAAADAQRAIPQLLPSASQRPGGGVSDLRDVGAERARQR